MTFWVPCQRPKNIKGYNLDNVYENNLLYGVGLFDVSGIECANFWNGEAQAFTCTKIGSEYKLQGCSRDKLFFG